VGDVVRISQDLGLLHVATERGDGGEAHGRAAACAAQRREPGVVLGSAAPAPAQLAHSWRPRSRGVGMVLLLPAARAGLGGMDLGGSGGVRLSAWTWGGAEVSVCQHGRGGERRCPSVSVDLGGSGGVRLSACLPRAQQKSCSSSMGDQFLKQ